MTDTHISQAIYVLGDENTIQCLGVLVAQAAERGAVIGKAFAFRPGQAACTDDLSSIEAVVEALGRAIARRRPIWLPFWQDLRREEHLRALSLTLQRHGTNLLVGPQLRPMPVEGGVTAMDAALRDEIRGVFRLNDAATAAAGIITLGAEIEAELSRTAPVPKAAPTPSWQHDALVHGYWLLRGRLLATEYPGHRDPARAAARLAVLCGAGVTSFVDLTVAGERTWGGAPMVPYAGLLPDGVTHRRFAIPDRGVIADDGYDEILAHIRAELDAGKTVAVHCWGGKGRTGTVVGAWLIDTEALGYPEVIDRIGELRAGSRKAGYRVPETSGQRDVLRRRAQRRRAPR